MFSYRSDSDLRVLSIQSHVVHGYCGNKCATLPLQVHGFEVDAINSVQFSNHTAYPCFKGQALNDDQLWEIYQGLHINKINTYSHLLTGYARSESFLRRIVDILKDLRAQNRDLLYICDPVMGDNDAFYVPETCLPVYRDIIPLATVITPNQFELQVLSGITIDSQANLVEAMNALHDRGSNVIVVTSTNLAPNGDVLYGYGSELRNGKKETFRFEVSRFPATFFGTGDLFASLLLIWLQKSDNLKMAVEKVASCIQDVLSRTYKFAQTRNLNGSLNSSDLELRLVQSISDILDPKSKITMVDL